MNVNLIVISFFLCAFSCFVVVLLVLEVYYFYFFLLALLSNAPVSPFKLVKLSLHRINVSPIVRAYILGVNAGLHITVDELASHYKAGGKVNQVVAALIVAKNKDMELSFQEVAASDLYGYDVLKMVNSN
jgi:uncharacterized protein YqfA (UPF0365 family)